MYLCPRLLRDGRDCQPCFCLNGCWPETVSCQPIPSSVSPKTIRTASVPLAWRLILGAFGESACRYTFRTRSQQRPLADIYSQFLASQGTFTARKGQNFQNKNVLNVCICFQIIRHPFHNNLCELSGKIWPRWSHQLQHWSFPQLWKRKEMKTTQQYAH